MPFIEVASVPARPTVPGFVGRFIHGERQTIAVWEIAASSVSPVHQHPHEQTITVLSGRFELTMAGETRLLPPGLMALVPPTFPTAAGPSPTAACSTPSPRSARTTASARSAPLKVAGCGSKVRPTDPTKTK